MIEQQFTDPYLASLYDLRFTADERDDLNFYLPMIMSARSVLDVGCGTGALLRRARESGHTGRLCGLDPAGAMLDRARTTPDIEWILGDLSSVHWQEEFDLIVMTGHAFQELQADEEIHTALSAVNRALTSSGRFAFETRNPLVHGWENWDTQYSADILDPSGTVVHCEYRVERPVTGDIVRSTQTYSRPGWDEPRVTQGALRFVTAETLARFLSSAGLSIVEQFGDWDRSPLTDTSPEIITIAVRA